MDTSSDMSIVPRLKDYFLRQSAWLESLTAELEGLPDALESEDVSPIENSARQWDTRNRAFAEEFVVLKKEWDHTPAISPDDRRTIRALARDVEARVETVRRIFVESAALAQTKSAALKEDLDDLNLGRDMLGKYRIPSAPDSGFFDSSM